MSYDIIRGLRLDKDNKRVHIKAAANNVTPRAYTWHDSSYFADLWQKKGLEAVEIELVKAFESGNFQGGTSKYKQAADRLRRMPQYKAFDWRLGGLGEEFQAISDRRREKQAEFDALVLRALNMKTPKEKFVIKKKNWDGQVVYFYHRANAHFCRWFLDIKKAKVFNYKKEAEARIGWFQNSDSWEIQQIA